MISGMIIRIGQKTVLGGAFDGGYACNFLGDKNGPFLSITTNIRSSLIIDVIIITSGRRQVHKTVVPSTSTCAIIDVCVTLVAERVRHEVACDEGSRASGPVPRTVLTPSLHHWILQVTVPLFHSS